jgi:predicted branched-subunit amino acid permease
LTTSSAKNLFWQGFKSGVPFTLVIFPVGMLFGVFATEAGLSIIEALSFSIVVIAGAAQFTALQLMIDQETTWIIVLSALAINLRMAMYSASLTLHIGSAPLWQRALVAYLTIDQSYAVSATKFAKDPHMSRQDKVIFFLASALPVVPIWYIATLLGAVLGYGMPSWFSMDMALPLVIAAMIGPMLTNRAHQYAALTGTLVALALNMLPLNLGLFCGGIFGMIVGAATERRSFKKQTIQK